MGSIRAAFLSALGFASASQLAGAASAQQFEVPASAKAAIVEQTNAYRAEKGLPPLSENAEASREAQAYANTWRRELARVVDAASAGVVVGRGGGCHALLGAFAGT